MRFSTLAEWLHWQESLHFSEIEMGLGRVGQVALSMSLIECLPSTTLKFKGTDRQPRVITVAGTNGKGSCIASLEQLLLQQGFSVGAYTSPHFLHYCERIRINGQPAPELDVCRAFDVIDRARGDISLTYFEFGTLAGLEVFRQADVDFVLLEVGLGGRLDAVNIIDSDVAVITSIALDHEDWLGSDLDVIAAEKSGIVRAGKPVISTVQQSEQAVANTCKEKGALLLQQGRDFELTQRNECWSIASDDYSLIDMPLPSLPLPSVASAVLALRQLGVNFTAEQLREYLPQLSLPGRYQQLCYQERHIILDVAHNPAAADHLAERLRLRTNNGSLFALMAIMADKDIAGVITPLVPEVQSWIAAALPNNPRAAKPEIVAAELQSQGVDTEVSSSVVAGFERMMQQSKPGDTLLVLGSFFTVAEVLELLEQDNG